MELARWVSGEMDAMQRDGVDDDIRAGRCLADGVQIANISLDPADIVATRAQVERDGLVASRGQSRDECLTECPPAPVMRTRTGTR